jgi:small subunit ribosomal protein S5
VPKHQNTITHEILGVFGSGRVFLRPASPGTVGIAGAGCRAVLELAGIRDVLAKSLGSSNPINLCRATEAGLRGLRRPVDVARLRGKTVAQILPARKKADDVPVESS